MKKLVLLVLTLSLAANLALALRIFRSPHRSELSHGVLTDNPPPAAALSAHPTGAVPPSAATEPAGATTRVTTPAAREGELARMLRSARTDDELRAAVRQLRDAGYPAPIVRAILNELLVTRFAAREPKEPFWRRGQPSPESVAASQALATERRALLEQLLGDMALPSATLAPNQREQRYGALTDEKLNAVARIERDYDELRAKAHAEREPNFLNRLSTGAQQEQLMEAEKLRDLATVLTPEELYQYELRNTLTARKLMTQLAAVDVSAQEFAQLYEITKKFETEHPVGGGPLDIGLLSARMQAQVNLSDEARKILPDDRYYKFLASHDPNYATVARFTAEHPSITPAATVQLYKLQVELQFAMMQASQAHAAGKKVPFPNVRTYEQRLIEILGPAAADAFKKHPNGRMFVSQSRSVTTSPDN